MINLVKAENETKKQYEKRIENLKKTTSVSNVKGFNDTERLDRCVFIKVFDADGKLNDKVTIFNTVSPKVALEETNKVLSFLVRDYDEQKDEIDEKLKSFKFRGFKHLSVGDYNIQILCKKF